MFEHYNSNLKFFTRLLKILKYKEDNTYDIIMKQNTLDTTLAMLCMLTPVSPGVFAKELVIVSTTLLILRILVTRNIYYFIKKKVLIILLFSPSIIFAIFTSSESVIRFAPVLLLVLGFPFYGFKIKARPIMVLSIFILAYLIVTETLLAYGNSALLNFREVWYPGGRFASVFFYGTMDSFFSPPEGFRAGGLYYNPNVLAIVIVLYYLIFSVSFQYIEQKNINFLKKKSIIRKILYFVILCLVSFSLFYTHSRTSMITLIVFIGMKNFDITLLKRGVIKKDNFWPLLFVLIFLFFIGETIWDGVVNTEGSAYSKFYIFISYFTDASFLDLLFGGNFNIQFDNDYGNWIGASGFLGILAWINIIKMMYNTIPLTRALIIAFLLTAFGGTLFYGLLSGCIVLILLCITCSFWGQRLSEKESLKSS